MRMRRRKAGVNYKLALRAVARLAQSMMPRRIKVTVTRADIRSGKRRSILLCPIALALKRKTTEPVTVGSLMACIELTQYTLSSRATRFIRRYDRGLPVKPAKFIIERYNGARKI